MTAPGKLANSKFRSKPTPEFLRSWVEALESGEYKKGKFALCTTRGEGTVRRYCCLGVAAALNGDLTDRVEPTVEPPGDWLASSPPGKAFLLKSGDSTGLPHQLYGLTDNFMTELTLINDENYGFAKVVARIKAEFPDVFDPTP